MHKRVLHIVPSLLLAAILFVLLPVLALADNPPQSQWKEGLPTLQRLAPGTYGCKSVTCNDKDPAAMHCNLSKMTVVSIVVLDVHQVVIARGQNVYSFGCNANWTEVTLLQSGGHNARVVIATTDTNGQPQGNCYPAIGPGDLTCDPRGYNGATGWPLVSNMVDGTNITHSIIYAIDGAGYNDRGSVDQ